MIPTVRKLSASDGTDFESIASFVTKNYVGIWNGPSRSFILLKRYDICLSICVLPECNSYEELDELVYKECEEHILSVSESGMYTIFLGV